MTEHLESQLNELEQDRAFTVLRFSAVTDSIQSQSEVNRATVKLLEARAALRNTTCFVLVVAAVLAVIWTIHLA